MCRIVYDNICAFEIDIRLLIFKEGGIVKYMHMLRFHLED